MKTRILSLMAIAAMAAVPAPLALPAFAQAPSDAPNAAEQALRETLERGVAAFNKGDMAGYLSDFAPEVNYNELKIPRDRLVDINVDLKKAFPSLTMRYSKIRVRADSPDEGWATTIAEFSGEARNYENSGYPATYRESGQVSAHYKKVNGEWVTDEVMVAWNDSSIDVGTPFGALGFTALPTLTGVNQPYRLRLVVGHNVFEQTETNYAYTIVPFASVLDQKASEAVFAGLKFQAVPVKGVDVELRAPAKAGTYVHLMVLSKGRHDRMGDALIGQKVYTRLVRVEE